MCRKPRCSDLDRKTLADLEGARRDLEGYRFTGQAICSTQSNRSCSDESEAPSSPAEIDLQPADLYRINGVGERYFTRRIGSKTGAIFRTRDRTR